MLTDAIAHLEGHLLVALPTLGRQPTTRRITRVQSSEIERADVCGRADYGQRWAVARLTLSTGPGQVVEGVIGPIVTGGA